jgi:hypothetical protein
VLGHSSEDKPRLRAPYLVRLIKPNPIASHDWHVQPNCQRSLRVARLSGTLGIETPEKIRSVLELDALGRNSLLKEFLSGRDFASITSLRLLRFSLVPDFGAGHAHRGGVQRFCANFLRVLKRLLPVKPEKAVPILIRTPFPDWPFPRSVLHSKE